MTHVHSTATRPGTAVGGDPLRAPVSARVAVDAAGPGAAGLREALSALGLSPEAPDAGAGSGAPAAYCALLIGEEAYGAERSAGLDRERIRGAALAMAAAGRGRLVLVTDATGETHAGTDPDRYARLAADRAWWQHLVTEVAGRGVTGNTVTTGYSPALGHHLSEAAEAGLLRYLVQRRPTTAADVAATVAFLLSAGCSYLVGETVPVDGGAGLGQIPSLPAGPPTAPAPRRSAPQEQPPPEPVTGQDLLGHKVLVAGASSGIGRAAALHLAGRGADVVLAARRTQALEEVAAEIEAQGRQAWTLRCDLSDPEDAATLGERAWKAADGVTTLLYAAGHLGFSAVGGDPASAARTFAVNLHSFVAVTEYLTARWRQEKVPGAVVGVSSVSSTLSPVAGLEYYGASKAAMAQYIRCLAVSVARHGIRANCVAPGIIETPMGDAAGPDHRRGWISRIPAGRVGEPREVAAVLGFLLSGSAARVTGAVLRADGGFGLGDVAPLRPGFPESVEVESL
ncbi:MULTISPECIES: SDR family oxidoreductase [Streptomyces]|uniref:SDR family NAD(P)-dependent oxidoreductase n=1 Tax=Streptomyces TaxID=1883 RepID=UPI000D50CAF6|nr:MULTISPECIES: SDR family oxidoreductase [Streptomyces]MXG26361.1 SDR family oxidoreductase [Streptomyces sp. YIM 132580]PVC77917.1 short-chain dehydrogenase [Streptomyces sp. CS065A]